MRPDTCRLRAKGAHAPYDTRAPKRNPAEIPDPDPPHSKTRIFTCTSPTTPTPKRSSDPPAPTFHRLDALFEVHIIMSCRVSPCSMRCAIAVRPDVA